MTKQDIIKTAIYFADDFKRTDGRKVIYGDLPDRYERAEHLANEMLRWPSHKAWFYIKKHYKLLPSQCN